MVLFIFLWARFLPQLVYNSNHSIILSSSRTYAFSDCQDEIHPEFESRLTCLLSYILDAIVIGCFVISQHVYDDLNTTETVFFCIFLNEIHVLYREHLIRILLSFFFQFIVYDLLSFSFFGLLTWSRFLFSYCRSFFFSQENKCICIFLSFLFSCCICECVCLF